jgi:hypothetical protein
MPSEETEAIGVVCSFASSYTIIAVDDKVFAVPMQRGDESFAMAVRIRTAEEANWTAAFRLCGNGKRREVYTCPNPNELCVLCGDRASILNVGRAGNYEERSFESITQIVPARSAGLLLLATYTNVIAYGPQGVVWSSRDLFWDELRIVSVDEVAGVARIEGFNAPNDRIEEAVVDLGSGVRLGAAS